MADDITLTVRVRDMTQGDFNRLTGRLNRMRQSLNGVNRTTSTAGRNSQMLGRDLSQLSARFTQMSRTGRLTRRELDGMSNTLTTMSRTSYRAARAGEITWRRFFDLRREIGRMRAEMRLVGRDGNMFQRMNDRLLVFQHGMRNTATHSHALRRSLNRIGDGAISGLRGALLATTLLTGAMRKLGAIININKRYTAILLAVLLLLGPAASALGSLLVVALGGAFIALGALALKNSTTVKAAFADMKKSVAADVREAALPMEGALSQGIRMVSTEVSKMKPALEGAFTATGPLIENFVGAFTDLASMSLPGITTALEGLGPAMEGFRVAMGLVGEGIGEMFAAMTAGGGAEALRDIWITLGGELKNLLVGIGEFINMANQSESSTSILIGFFRALSGVMNLVEGGLRVIDFLFGGLFSTVNDSVRDIDALASGMGGLGDAMSLSGKDVGTLRTELEAVEKELAAIEKKRREYDGPEGPAKDYALRGGGLDASDRALKEAQEKRKALTGAISKAEADAAKSTRDHASAVDALKASIKALNEQALGQLDAQSAMEKAIDDAAAKAKELAGKVDIKGGFINLDTDAGRQANEVMSAIAKSTAEYVAKLEEAKAPQSEINAAWARGREQLLGLSGTLQVSKADLQAYADRVLATPESVRTKLLLDKKQAEAGVAATKERLAEVDGTVAEAAATVANFRAMERLSQVESKIRALDGMTANTYINTFMTTTHRSFRQGERDYTNKTANGGLLRKYASGGNVMMAPNGFIRGPGTPVSDSIPALFASGANGLISDTEFVVNARSTRKHLPLLEAINKDRLPKFAKGGLTKAQKDARSDARSDLTISHFGKMAGYKNDEFRKALGLPDALGSLVDSLNHWRSVIKKATSGALEKSLLKQLDKAGKALIKYEKSLSKVEKSLDKAKEKLDGLKQASAALRDSVKNGVMSATNITQVASGDKNVTMGDVMARMRESVDKSTAFAKALADLKKKGVSKEIIQQIAEAGIEGGGLETAGAILGASSSEIQTMNEMQKKINASAKSAGKTAADAMYAAGIKAAEGLVKGLTKKKKDIEKAMMDIAKAMEKSIKKALGIKSPSKVMQDVGHFTAEGFAIGVDKNKHIDKAWTSILPEGPSSHGAAVMGSSGGGGQYIFPIYVGTKMIDEVILDSNRRTVRTRGGNVQAVYGR